MSLHPFFRKASTTLELPQDPASLKSSSTLDPGNGSVQGVDEGDIHEESDQTDPSIDVTLNDASDLKHYELHVSSHSHTLVHGVSERDHGGSMDVDVDPNIDRRKRRRTTPSTTEGERKEEPPPYVSPRRDGHDWQCQLEEAADNGGNDSQGLEDVTAARPQRSFDREQDESEAPITTLKPPRGSTGGMSPTTAPTETTQKSYGRGSTHSSKTTTPRKKVLKLNPNGRLLSSPIETSSGSNDRGKKPKLEQVPTNIPANSMKITIRYGADKEARAEIGKKISEVLKPSLRSESSHFPAKEPRVKVTHPFFLGKLAPRLNIEVSEASSKEQDSEREGSMSPRTKKAPAWKDIVFASSKSLFTKTVDVLYPIWPPRGTHHLGVEVRNLEDDRQLPNINVRLLSKSKEPHTRICRYEDILITFSTSLFEAGEQLSDEEPRPPERAIITGRQLLKFMDQKLSPTLISPRTHNLNHPAVCRLRSLLPISSTAYDQGRAESCVSWTMKNAPCSAAEVLQPEAASLRDWLAELKVSSVLTKVQSGAPRTSGNALSSLMRQRKKRKKSDGLDDFVISSDDEAGVPTGGDMANAILISGPPGCGKTASVFAVAKELDFEVFEIHPGMRRSAKDIFDKVGDMTQNHLVQAPGRPGIADEILPALVDLASIQEEAVSGTRGRMKKLLTAQGNTSRRRKAPKQAQSHANPKIKSSKPQKQSLILFEEVDILFDEDKNFWSGVLTLIRQSKRPVVLTCNDEREVPAEELSANRVLRYEPPSPDLATEYMLALAANEGHVLNPRAVDGLYRSKNKDLRATISELDFWCQMGIGSKKGGLDWMIDRPPLDGSPNQDAERVRVFSKDTYVPGLGLIPRKQSKDNRQLHEDLLSSAREFLEIPVSHWHGNDGSLHLAPDLSESLEPTHRLENLRCSFDLSEARSVLDLLDDSMTTAFSAAITAALTPGEVLLNEEDILKACVANRPDSGLSRDKLLSAFDPITMEKPTFPPAVGRLAPSFDGPTSAIAADIAPYVRFIVSFDQRLEQHREALTGEILGKRTRTTRAARAALEGGSKANTRRERWFPSKTDFSRIMSTSGQSWPLGLSEGGITLSQDTVVLSSQQTDSMSDEKE